MVLLEPAADHRALAVDLQVQALEPWVRVAHLLDPAADLMDPAAA